MLHLAKVEDRGGKPRVHLGQRGETASQNPRMPPAPPEAMTGTLDAFADRGEHF